MMGLGTLSMRRTTLSMMRLLATVMSRWVCNPSARKKRKDERLGCRSNPHSQKKDKVLSCELKTPKQTPFPVADVRTTPQAKTSTSTAPPQKSQTQWKKNTKSSTALPANNPSSMPPPPPPNLSALARLPTSPFSAPTCRSGAQAPPPPPPLHQTPTATPPPLLPPYAPRHKARSSCPSRKSRPRSSP